MCALLPDRSEQESDEPAVAAGAEDEQRGVARRAEQHRRRGAVDGAAVDLEAFELRRVRGQRFIESHERVTAVFVEVGVAGGSRDSSEDPDRRVPREHRVEAGAAESSLLRGPPQRRQRSGGSVDADDDRVREEPSLRFGGFD